MNVTTSSNTDDQQNNWYGEKISKGEFIKVKTSAVFQKTVNGWQQLPREFH